MQPGPGGVCPSGESPGQASLHLAGGCNPANDVCVPEGTASQSPLERPEDDRASSGPRLGRLLHSEPARGQEAKEQVPEPMSLSLPPHLPPAPCSHMPSDPSVSGTRCRVTGTAAPGPSVGSRSCPPGREQGWSRGCLAGEPLGSFLGSEAGPSSGSSALGARTTLGGLGGCAWGAPHTVSVEIRVLILSRGQWGHEFRLPGREEDERHCPDIMGARSTFAKQRANRGLGHEMIYRPPGPVPGQKGVWIPQLCRHPSHSMGVRAGPPEKSMVSKTQQVNSMKHGRT